mmetsp:Transcript_2219/g.9605  ORF Transcript_2219/g.9605 Transcript_2219/m.9605 type:complete len:214 (+) Transcript_2219:283-924(+)
MPRSKEQDVSVFVRVVGSGMDEAGVEEHALPVLPSSGFVAHLNPAVSGWNFQAKMGSQDEVAEIGVGLDASSRRLSREEGFHRWNDRIFVRRDLSQYLGCSRKQATVRSVPFSILKHERLPIRSVRQRRLLYSVDPDIGAPLLQRFGAFRGQSALQLLLDDVCAFLQAGAPRELRSVVPRLRRKALDEAACFLARSAVGFVVLCQLLSHRDVV